jgi:hypothetical protein
MWDIDPQNAFPAFNAQMQGWLLLFVVDSIINLGASLNFHEISLFVFGAFWN